MALSNFTRWSGWMGLVISLAAVATGSTVAIADPVPAPASAAPVSNDGFPSDRSPSVIVSWLGQKTDIVPASVISVGADMVVAIAKTGLRDEISGNIKGVHLRGEAISAKFAAAMGGRSSSTTLDVNCTDGTAMLYQTKIFAQNNLKGAVIVLPGSNSWITPPKAAYLWDAVQAVCDARFERPLAPQTLAAAQVPTLRGTAAPEADPETPPKASPPSVTVAPRPSDTEVQVVASATPEAAQAILNQIARAFPSNPSQTFRIEPVTVGTKTLYRGLLGGFADRAQATRFCARLKAEARACMVR
jgi:hypothetical protein